MNQPVLLLSYPQPNNNLSLLSIRPQHQPPEQCRITQIDKYIMSSLFVKKISRNKEGEKPHRRVNVISKWNCHKWQNTHCRNIMFELFKLAIILAEPLFSKDMYPVWEPILNGVTFTVWPLISELRCWYFWYFRFCDILRRSSTNQVQNISYSAA